MRCEVAPLRGDTHRGDISAWTQPPRSHRPSCGHTRSVLPQDRSVGMSLLEGVGAPALCKVLGDLQATKSAALLLQGLPVSSPCCNLSAGEPGSPGAEIGAGNVPLPWRGCFLPISLLPNKHPCQNS